MANISLKFKGEYSMNNEINEIILRSKPSKEPMPFERLKFLCYFIAGMAAEVFGFVLLLVIILCMAGVLH